MPLVHGLDASNVYTVPALHSREVDPTEADNYTQGFRAGDEWINTEAGTLYKCVQSDADTAVWISAGEDGQPGPPGAKGDKGDKGDVGAVGPVGPAGPTSVSSNADNLATLGTDSLLLVPNRYAFKGVTDASDAAAGNVGEYLTADNIAGLPITANVGVSVCTLTLPPGCWEVWGACDFAVTASSAERAGAPIQPSQLGSGISVTPDSLPTDQELILGTGVMQLIFSPLAAGQRQVLITGQCRSNSTGPITLFLVAQIGTGSATVKGYISARRVR